MKKIILHLLLMCVPCVLVAQEEKLSLDELKEGLSSPDYHKREEASAQLWGRALEAVPVLDEVIGGDDPEAIFRAVKIRRKILMGIAPDTPPGIVKIIEGYFSSKGKGKKEAIQQLYRAGAYAFLLRLELLEENPEDLSSLKKMIKAGFPWILDFYYRQGKLDRVRELLLRGEDVASMIRAGDFLDRQGNLDEEIVRLRALSDEKSKARYLAYLRVKGDLPLILRESRRLGDRKVEAVASLLLGDPLPMIESGKLEKTGAVADGLYRRWALAGLKGDAAVKNQIVDELVGLYERRSERKHVINCLFRMGFAERGTELLTEKGSWSERLDNLLDRHQYLRIPEFLGIEPDKVSVEWIEKEAGNLTKSLERGGNLMGDTPLLVAARFYDERGLPGEADKIYRRFFDVLRNDPDNDLVSWLESYREGGSLLAVGAGQALAHEIDEHGIPLRAVLGTIIAARYEASVAWFLDIVSEQDKSLETLDLLLLAFSFLGEQCVEEEMLSGWYERLEALAKKDFLEEGDDLALRNMIILCKCSSRSEELLRLLKVRGGGEKMTSLDKLRDRGLYSGYMEDWEDALSSLELLTKNKHLDNVDLELQKSFYLREMGRVEEAEVMWEDAMLRGHFRNGEHFRNRALTHMMFSAYAQVIEFPGDPEKAYRFIKQGILRVEEEDMGELNYGRYLGFAATAAAQRRDWKVAHALYEVRAWRLNVRYMNEYRAERNWAYSSESPLYERFYADFSKGMYLNEMGESRKAEEQIRAAHDLISGSGALADEFFPALREAGLTKLHDELIEDSLSVARSIIEAYPQDANARNNFGWLASRAMKRLDEAKVHMDEAVRLAPRSRAYLDTLAEVWFAMGDREKAVEWSKRSLQNGVTDFQLRAQHRRFQFGEFPVK